MLDVLVERIYRLTPSHFVWRKSKSGNNSATIALCIVILYETNCLTNDYYI